MELPGNILHRLGVILAVVHTGTIKLANKAQHLGGQRRIGVWGFFFWGGSCTLGGTANTGASWVAEIVISEVSATRWISSRTAWGISSS